MCCAGRAPSTTYRCRRRRRRRLHPPALHSINARCPLCCCTLRHHPRRRLSLVALFSFFLLLLPSLHNHHHPLSSSVLFASPCPFVVHRPPPLALFLASSPLRRLVRSSFSQPRPRVVRPRSRVHRFFATRRHNSTSTHGYPTDCISATPGGTTRRVGSSERPSSAQHHPVTSASVDCTLFFLRQIGRSLSSTDPTPSVTRQPFCNLTVSIVDRTHNHESRLRLSSLHTRGSQPRPLIKGTDRTR